MCVCVCERERERARASGAPRTNKTDVGKAKQSKKRSWIGAFSSTRVLGRGGVTRTRGKELDSGMPARLSHAVVCVWMVGLVKVVVAVSSG